MRTGIDICKYTDMYCIGKECGDCPSSNSYMSGLRDGSALVWAAVLPGINETQHSFELDYRDKKYRFTFEEVEDESKTE